VVEGSVQVVGKRLRVNVQLIDAASDEHLWAEHYDRTLNDAFAIQSEVAKAIVAAVGAALSAAEQGRLSAPPSANAEALKLYLQGHEYYSRPGQMRHDRVSAQQLYERALALDPNFALAHAALSIVHGQFQWLKYDPSPARVVAQREEAETALRLAPDLPQAHFAMGLVHYQVRRDYRKALDELRIALEGIPNDAGLWFWIGGTERRLGHWDKSLAAFEKAKQLDPRNANVFYGIGGYNYLYLHRYADAANSFGRALSLAPDLHEAAIQKGWTYVRWKGQLDTLRSVLDRIPRNAELAHSSSVAAQRAEFLLLERDTDGLLGEVRAATSDHVEAEWFFLPWDLYAGWAHQLRGDHTASRAAFQAAVDRLDSALKRNSDDFRVHVALGLALAGLGRRDEVRREARWLQQSRFYRDDAMASPRLAEARAQMLGQVGDADAALDEIERILAEPSVLTVHTLRLDPRWDLIREHPRFKALLAKHAS
jgi:serine/threonine-protein kinase